MKKSLVFVAEFLGCVFFTLLSTLHATPQTNACVLACYVYFSSHVSSAHLNPAVTLAFVLLGHNHPRDLLLYVPAQISGALVGATFARFLVPGSSERQLGCFIPASDLNVWQIFGFEFLLTMSFITSIFVVVYYTKDKLGFGNMGPLLIGLALLANAEAGANYTGSALNPARVIASPIIIGCENNSSVHAYIFGEILGAIAAVIVTMTFFGINLNSWYAEYLRESHREILPAFDYSLRHDKAPQDMNSMTRGRGTNGPNPQATPPQSGGSCRSGRTLACKTPDSEGLLPALGNHQRTSTPDSDTRPQHTTNGGVPPVFPSHIKTGTRT